MSSFDYFVIFIFAYLLSANGLPRNKPCPLVKPVDDFNFTQYGAGIWYEMARYANVFESTNCGSFEMIPVGDKRKAKPLRSELLTEESPYFVETLSEQDPESPTKGVILHTVQYGKPKKIAVIRDKILAIDYDKYFIGYTCIEDEKTETSDEYVWILTRSKNVEKEVKETIDNYIKTSNVIDPKRLIWVDPIC